MTKEELIELLLDPAFDPICDCGEPGYACKCCWTCGAISPRYCLCEHGPNSKPPPRPEKKFVRKVPKIIPWED